MASRGQSNTPRHRGGKAGGDFAAPLRLVGSGGPPRGLSRAVVDEISWQRREPDWMRRKRIQALEVFERMPLPGWGPDLSRLDFRNVAYLEGQLATLPGGGWDTARSHLMRELGAKGVIFISLAKALSSYPDLVQEHFMKRNVPVYDSRFAALNGAVWRGGWFVYVPAGVTVDLPLRPPFAADDFAHTLLIAEAESAVRFVEDRLATNSGGGEVSSSVVEVFVKERARVTFVSVDNAASGGNRFQTRRAMVTGDEGAVRWIDASLGTALTMVYPGSHLLGRASRAEHLGLWLTAGETRKDVGARVIHVGEGSTSRVVSRILAANGGWGTVRTVLRVAPSAAGAAAEINTGTLLMDDKSRLDVMPDVQVHQSDVSVEERSSSGSMSEQKLWRLVAEGLDAEEARTRAISAFAAPVIRELYPDLAVDVDRLLRNATANSSA